MLERIKNGVLAVGVCYPCYLLAYGTAYLFEPLLVAPDRHFAAGTMAAIAGMALLRMAWLFARAAVRGRPVFELPPEPNVTASILGLGPVPARHDTDAHSSVASVERRLQRTPQPAAANHLPALSQRA